MEKVLILDFGSQYTQLIARRIRELHVYSEIQPFNYPLEKITLDKNIKAIILSGGPQSVYADNAPRTHPEFFELNLPILGICYGLQLIAYAGNGKVDPASRREYGRAELIIDNDKDLLFGIDSPSVVWMSHGDHLKELPQDFETIGRTQNSPMAAIRHKQKPIYGIQFHPEVHHTVNGKQLLENFLFGVSGFKGNWTPRSFIDEITENLKARIGERKVLCALSGGVDSSVTAALLHRIIGDQLSCIFVDTGLLRAGEVEEVNSVFREHFQMKLICVTSAKEFTSKLTMITDPEEKRKIIGNTFIEIFENEAIELGDFQYLAQGTLYPDVIESISFKGPSATIKSHHNVGGLPEKMNLELIEPLRELFKDEVRQVGRELGLPEKIIGRHPFPGPGLAIRIIGEVTPNRLKVIREADMIFIEELKREDLYSKIWQAFCVLLPVQTVGVMGDERTYENVIALRAVTSTDGMTANWYPLPYDFITRVSNRIISEVKGINRVVYDVSSKPPATIEWE
jgi:GMP synthase (glutamine-hydrolysing)